jgi:hypothetical protein
LSIGIDHGSLIVMGRYGYRPLPGKIPKAEMDALLHQMSAEDQTLVGSTYELDTNSLDENNCQAPEYVLVDTVEKLKPVEAKAFAVLRGAAEKKYGKLQDLPR